MKRLLLCAALCVALTGGAARADLSDAEIRARIISESIAAYRGSCPCPNSVDGAGKACGGRSAYSKAGGQSPICYAEDISDEQVKQYRARKGE